MGKLINVITGTKTVVFGNCQDTKVTSGKRTHGMRTLHAARFLLARLAGRFAGRVTMLWCHAVGVTSAAPSLEYSYCSSGQRPRGWRQYRPGASVPVSRF
jgi:hypothetical protein